MGLMLAEPDSRLSVKGDSFLCSSSSIFFTIGFGFSFLFSPTLVIFFFPQLDGLLTDRESLPERSKEIRERLRGKGLPSGKMSYTDMHIEAAGAVFFFFLECVAENFFSGAQGLFQLMVRDFRCLGL